ncbi:MAG: class I SAM-dependent methyltransferase [Chitinophagaceae bacterium]
MFRFHADRRRYFDIQAANSRDSVIPFIETYRSLPAGAKILEVGCGEGGVLRTFIEKGHTGVGIEMEKGRVNDGAQWMQEELATGAIRFIIADIYQVCPEQLTERFHLIIVKDVIEHLPDKKALLERLRDFLCPGGTIFFGFPPWQMPFGGHQQLCGNKYLSRLPWLHLLPRSVYKKILSSGKEPVSDLMDIYDARISIEGFEKLVKQSDYCIIGKKHFLISPIYRYKFGYKPREQLFVIRHLPYVRNLFTTAVYYLIAANPGKPHNT